MSPLAHPSDCPSWDYEDHPQHEDILPRKTEHLLIQLRNNNIQTLDASLDTRRIHEHLFTDLTPQHHRYYAGNYRGDEFRCLKYYQVSIRNDPRVGVSPSQVSSSIGYLKNGIDNSIGVFDTADKLPEASLPKEQKILYLVTLACRIFVEFLRIHPYANGNGHIGRFIVIAILGRYGFWPKRFPLDERPPDPPYSTLIKEYRDGNREGLENFMLKCILGTV